MKRIAPMAKALRKARRLHNSGSLPQALWGATSLGMSPTATGKLVTQLASATGISAKGRCATTAIAIALGPDKDPRITLPIQQADLWINLWRFDPTLRALSARHWKDALVRVKSKDGVGANWNMVLSPWTAFMAILLDQGWCLDDVARWKDPQGDDWIPNFQAPKESFLQVIGSFASAAVWKNASASWQGKGLEHGVDWAASLALHNHLSATLLARRDDDNTSEQSNLVNGVMDSQLEVWSDHALTWLELLLTGGYWTNDRAAEVHGVPARCTRCRAGLPETPFHLLWGCEANAHIDDERVSSTQELIEQARNGLAEVPCLWLRGLLPRFLVPVNSPLPMEVDLQYVGVWPGTWWPPGCYHTDGSGGRFSRYTLIRRCGIGIAYMAQNDEDFSHAATGDPESLFKWGAFTALPGERQTVPRSELMAICIVLQHVNDGNTDIVTDCKNNANAFQRGKQYCLESEHADVWEDIWQILDDREISLSVRWSKGHADNPEVMAKYEVKPRDLFGNLCADALANRGSDAAEVSLQDSMTLLWHYSLVRRIQARAVVIMSSTLEGRTAAPARPKRPRELKMSRDALIMQSSHQVTLSRGVLHCHRCHTTSPVEQGAARRWLASQCVPNTALIRTLVAGTTKPTAVPQGQMVIVSRQTIHHSHQLAVYRGLYFCTRCGYHGSKKLQKLTGECSGMVGKAINRVLALRQGNLPSGLDSWPNDVQRHRSWVDLL